MYKCYYIFMSTIQNIGTWITHSNTQKQQILFSVVLIAGITIIALTFLITPLADMQISQYATLTLGLLLIVVSVFSLLTQIHQTVIVDKTKREIQLVTKSRTGTQTKTIPFDSVTTVTLSEHGDPEGGTITYYVTITDKAGEEIPLFFPAYFEGRFSRTIMKDNIERIVEALK